MEIRHPPSEIQLLSLYDTRHRIWNLISCISSSSCGEHEKEVPTNFQYICFDSAVWEFTTNHLKHNHMSCTICVIEIEILCLAFLLRLAVSMRKRSQQIFNAFASIAQCEIHHQPSKTQPLILYNMRHRNWNLMSCISSSSYGEREKKVRTYFQLIRTESAIRTNFPQIWYNSSVREVTTTHLQYNYFHRTTCLIEFEMRRVWKDRPDRFPMNLQRLRST